MHKNYFNEIIFNFIATNVQNLQNQIKLEISSILNLTKLIFVNRNNNNKNNKFLQ